MVAAAGLAAAGAAAIAFGKASVDAFSESELAIAQTNAVLKSTGGVAGVSAQAIDELASSLEKTTRFSDEQVRSAENMLLTFTNIGKKVFPDATKAVADMATAMGTDLKSTSIQVGKALQDPVLGVTSLQRVGVRLTETQKDLVKSLVDVGDTAGAQTVILDELKKEFGGSAEAAGNTFAGSLDKLNNMFNNLMETIGGGIAQVLVPAITQAQALIQQWGDGSNPVIETIKNTFMSLWNAYMAYNNYMASIFLPMIQAVGTFFMQWIVPALQTVWAEIQTNLMPALREMWTTLGPILTPILKVLAAFIGGVFIVALLAAVGAIRAVIWIVTEVIRAFNNWVTDVKMMPGAIVGNFEAMVNGIKGALSGVWNAITEPFRKAFDWVKDQANKVKDSVAGALDPNKRHSPSLVDKIQTGTADIKSEYSSLFNNLSSLGGGFKVADLAPGSSMSQQSQATVMQQASPTINVSINSVYSSGTEMEKRKFAQEIITAMQDIANSKNTTVGGMLS